MGMPLRILQVEDEAITAMQMDSALRAIPGCATLPHVATGEAAIASARKNRPDLILMDIGLAGPMDGIEAASAIRRESEVPIIFITGYEDAGLKARAESLRPLAFLMKPHVMGELRSLIVSQLASKPD